MALTCAFSNGWLPWFLKVPAKCHFGGEVGASTGQRTRFVVKVPANADQGSVIGMMPSLQKGFVSVIAGGSPYGANVVATSYTNDLKEGSSATAPDKNVDKMEASSSFICGVTVDTNATAVGDIGTDSGIRELVLTSTISSPDTPTKLTDQACVTNALKVS